jgi:hypothetical protein
MSESLSVQEAPANYQIVLEAQRIRPGYKLTEVGVIPQDWEVVRLTSVAQLESGHTPSRRNSTYWDGSVPWISLHDTEALGKREIFDTQRTITVEGLNNSSARLLPKGNRCLCRCNHFSGDCACRYFPFQSGYGAAGLSLL